MSLRLLLADCEVAAVTGTQAGVRIRLSAAHVEQTAAEPGGKPVEGWARGVELQIDAARLPADAATAIGRVSSGRARLGDAWLSKLPLPGAHSGRVELELSFANQTQLAIAGRALHCVFAGEANFAESLFC